MKKVKKSSFNNLKRRVKKSVFALTFLLAFAMSFVDAGAQVIQGPEPNWMNPAEANAIINNEMVELQDELDILPPGPASNAISEVMELYDLIQAYIIELDKVGESVYSAFGSQYGQMPVVYTEDPIPVTDSDAGSVTYLPVLNDAHVPNTNAPNYNAIKALYEDVVDKLTF